MARLTYSIPNRIDPRWNYSIRNRIGDLQNYSTYSDLFKTLLATRRRPARTTGVRLSPTHTIVVFTRATASVTCTAATRGGQRASDGRTPAAAQPRALAPVPQSGVQPPPAHGARCPGEQEARALGPASHMEARAPDAHRPRCARLPHSARSSARCAAHRPGTRQTAFSTSRTSEVHADLRMGES